ncbi:MAG: 4a-hydroxytetrahydrobiopterin dehydratase [Phycisphaerales bacterium]
MPKLTEDEVERAMPRVPEWGLVGEAIQRTFQFKDFQQSMRFVQLVAEAAEAANHHPDILIRYSRVTLTLQTHDAGGITEKDFDLAAKADAFAAELAPSQRSTGTPAKPKKKGDGRGA